MLSLVVVVSVSEKSAIGRNDERLGHRKESTLISNTLIFVLPSVVVISGAGMKWTDNC